MFEVKFSKDSEKFLDKSENEIVKRILIKVDKLAENPFPQDCKKLQGRSDKVFRIRIGNYRILYEVLHKENIINISRIDKRSKVYD